MADIEIRIYGDKELEARLESIRKSYPDITFDTMRKAGTALRKIVQQSLDSTEIKQHTGNLRKGMRFTIPKDNLGMNVTGEFRAETKKSSQMHLMEHGHIVKTRTGQIVGWYPGHHYSESGIKEYEPEFPRLAREAMEKLVKG